LNDKLHQLSNRICNELAELQFLAQRVAEGWSRAEHSRDDYYLDSVALNLHGLYSGLERLFELIASVVDGKKPGGENWHQELLKQMTAEIPKIRPAVISSSTWRRLEEYRGFRHVVRNIDGLVKSLLKRHSGESRGPEHLEITGFRLSPE